ncbi:C-type lectin domain family 2 member D-like [Candoia aspera]|uniref:C-type lectin domain family 2 member D-like n=1 Tax=Candoia aspera TaxID=51853 RepID=UPI002FD844F6
MEEATRQATVDETKRSTQDVCRTHKEDLSLFCMEEQIPLCSGCRKSWDHATHTIIPRNQPENQATGSVLSGGKDDFPESKPTSSSIVGFSNTNTAGFTEKGEATDGKEDDNSDKHALAEQWVDFNLEGKKEAGTQPNSRVKNSITWIVLILFIIQIAGLVTTIFVFTKAKPHLPPAAATTSCCPPGWHMSQGNCYHVLETERTWSDSQNHCFSFGASLAVFGDLEKLIGTVNARQPFNHWVGLRRSSEEGWKWPDGTVFNNLFEVEGDGRCAYLKNRAVSSADCAIWKKGLCSLKGLMNHQHCRAT